MMILLYSHDRWDGLALLDSRTGRISFHSRKVEPDLAALPIQGHFSRLPSGQLAILYREAGDLHLRLDHLDLLLSADMKARWEREDDYHTLMISRAGQPILHWTYAPPVIYPPLSEDPTPFVEEEDFDFGLFVCRVLIDDGLRKRIYTPT